VVNREMVAVLTKGTLSDPEMLTCQGEASYLLTLLEVPLPGNTPDAPGRTRFGACMVDVATGHMMIGQW
jgi:DNA mismatch repair protein MSH6